MNTKYFHLIAIVILIQFCNYNLAEDDVISCIQCGVKEDCSESLNEKATPCQSEAVKCYVRINDNHKIERGCLDPTTTCSEENNCIPTNSNNNDHIICIKCDGSYDKCSQSEMLNDHEHYQICPVDTKNCLIKVENKLVVRDCAKDSDKEQCTDENTCKICNTNNCNTGIFPTKRIRCYQCTGSSCSDTVVGSQSAYPCLHYDENDECYTKGVSETEMTRGCKSDSNDNQCSDNSKEGCLFCSTDNCNNFKYKRDQVLQCYQCSGNDCFKQQSGTDFKNCEKQILYSDDEYCYTNVNDNTIQRGCLHDNDALKIDECKDSFTDGKGCIKCNGSNGCNKQEVSTDFTCIICRSDMENKCWNNAEEIEGKKCRTDESNAEEGCFHGIWHGVAIRGCMIDASPQVQEVCKDQTNSQCRVCPSNNCNTWKSGVNRASLNIALISAMLIVFGILK